MMAKRAMAQDETPPPPKKTETFPVSESREVSGFEI